MRDRPRPVAWRKRGVRPEMGENFNDRLCATCSGEAQPHHFMGTGGVGERCISGKSPREARIYVPEVTASW